MDVSQVPMVWMPPNNQTPKGQEQMRQTRASKSPLKTLGKGKKVRNAAKITKQGPRQIRQGLRWVKGMDRQPYTARHWDSTLHSVEIFPTCKSGNRAAEHCGMTKACVVCRAKADLPFFAEGRQEKVNSLIEEIRLLRNKNKEWSADCGAQPEIFSNKW